MLKMKSEERKISTNSKSQNELNSSRDINLIMASSDEETQKKVTKFKLIKNLVRKK